MGGIKHTLPADHRPSDQMRLLVLVILMCFPTDAAATICVYVREMDRVRFSPRIDTARIMDFGACGIAHGGRCALKRRRSCSFNMGKCAASYMRAYI